MKGKKATGKGARSKGAPRSFVEYLAGVPKEARGMLKKMHAVIRSAVPWEAEEVISYQMPAFRTKKEVLVWFAAFAKHCSLFPKASIIEAFRKELKGFATSKGTIQFPTDKPLPVALIKRIVKARVAESNR